MRNDRPAQAVSAPIRITETGEAITVHTGGVVATISRRDGSLLQSVSVGGKQLRSEDFYLWRSDQTYTEKTPKGEVVRHRT